MNVVHNIMQHHIHKWMFSAWFSHTWLTYIFCINNFCYVRYEQNHFVLLFAEKYNIEVVMSLNGSD